jgi:dienelactone hydrolase
MMQHRRISIVLIVACACSATMLAQDSVRCEIAARAFVKAMSERRFDDCVAMFDSTMKAVMPAAKIEETWDGVQKQAGRFKEQQGLRYLRYGTYDIMHVTCGFEGNPVDARIVFNQTGKIAGLFFVPSQPAVAYSTPIYANREVFREEEVTVGSGRWLLRGTLTLPANKPNPPAIVLVHGSGPNDRDETIGPNKPFKDLAWGLATRGVAVLRYEKRTREYAKDMSALRGTLTVKDETIDDALEAVALLRGRKEIDTSRIYVLGHSLGGMLVPRIGVRDKRIAGFIILAGATRPLEDLIVEQLTYLFTLDGVIDEYEQRRLADAKKQRERIKALAPTDTGSAGSFFAAPASYWLDLKGYDPAALAMELVVPVLIMQGGRDYQVTKTDFDRWRSALKNKSNVTFSLYPPLNHLFISGEMQSTPSEYERAGHVSEEVLTDIVRWLKL